MSERLGKPAMYAATLGPLALQEFRVGGQVSRVSCIRAAKRNYGELPRWIRIIVQCEEGVRSPSLGSSGTLEELASESEPRESCRDLFPIELEVRFGTAVCQPRHFCAQCCFRVGQTGREEIRAPSGVEEINFLGAIRNGVHNTHLGDWTRKQVNPWAGESRAALVIRKKPRAQDYDILPSTVVLRTVSAP